MANICGNSRLQSNDVQSLRREFDLLRRHICQLLSNFSIAPPITNADMVAITNTSEGRIVYNTDLDALFVFANGAWAQITTS